MAPSASNANGSGLKIAAGYEKSPKSSQNKAFGRGAGDRTRTGTLSPAVDFESSHSEGAVSTRGLKADAILFDEFITDVNSRYFHEHGGLPFAEEFFACAHTFICEEVGEENILSSVDELRGGKNICSCRLGSFCRLPADAVRPPARRVRSRKRRVTGAHSRVKLFASHRGALALLSRKTL